MPDQYEEDLGEQAPAPVPTGEDLDNQTIKDLRAQLRKAEREATEGRRFREQFEASQREQQMVDRFREAGLPDSLAKLALREETPPEDVTEWAKQYGVLPQQVTAPAATSLTIAPPPTYSPTVGGTPPGAQAISQEELRQMRRTDPARAAQYIRQGLVNWKDPRSAEVIARQTGGVPS